MSDQVVKSVRFVKDPNYRRMHVSGMWGGANSTGELYFELYEDVFDLPEEIRFKLQEDGALSQEVWPDEQNFLRIVHAGVSIPMQVVPSVIEWLQSKLKEFEEMQKRSNQ